MIIAGIGCRRRTPASAIIAVLREAELMAACRAEAIAAPVFKSAEPGLCEAAGLLALPMLLVDDAELQAAQPRCETGSAAVARLVGHASIAEAAALAACGPHGRLRLARIVRGGATCALAESPPA